MCTKCTNMYIYIYTHTVFQFINLCIYFLLYLSIYTNIHKYMCVCVLCFAFIFMVWETKSKRLASVALDACQPNHQSVVQLFDARNLHPGHRSYSLRNTGYITKSILAYKYKCMPVQVVYLCSCQLLRVSSHSVLYQLSKEWGLHSMHSIQTNFELWRKNPITV